MYKCTFCGVLNDLRKFLDEVNKNGYTIISVTQDLDTPLYIKFK